MILLSISLTLSDGLLEKFPNIQGTYEQSSLVNGKLSWKSTTNAIWYSHDRKMWCIGSWSNIGTTRVAIHSYVYFGGFGYECPLQVPKDMWMYVNFDNPPLNWTNTNSNDIMLQC